MKKPREKVNTLKIKHQIKYVKITIHEENYKNLQPRSLNKAGNIGELINSDDCSLSNLIGIVFTLNTFYGFKIFKVLY